MEKLHQILSIFFLEEAYGNFLPVIQNGYSMVAGMIEHFYSPLLRGANFPEPDIIIYPKQHPGIYG
jgi:hypothetical protein